MIFVKLQHITSQVEPVAAVPVHKVKKYFEALKRYLTFGFRKKQLRSILGFFHSLETISMPLRTKQTSDGLTD